LSAYYIPLERHSAGFDEAVRIANDILGPNTQLQFVIQRSGKNKADIPIFEVKPTNPLDSFMCMVPAGHRMVLVAEGAMNRIQDAFYSFTSGLNVNPTNLLALCLLHEMGHIAHEDYASLTFAPRPMGFSMELTDMKRVELKADEFAANAVRNAQLTTNEFERFVAGAGVGMAVLNVSWNISIGRMITNFGAIILGDEKVLGENSLTHPNLEFRFLSMGYLITRSESSSNMLYNFLDQRLKNDTTSRIIWQSYESLGSDTNNSTNEP